MPACYNHPYSKRLLNSYLSDYIKQEIAGEALVRNLSPFSDFLEKAALSDMEIVSYSTFARDLAVSGHTIKEYYSILSDTLLGSFLPAYKKREKRRVLKQPKFYFADVGLVNSLINRFSINKKNESFGKAFENWIFHELNCCREYYQSFEKIFYWRLASGIEVDFIIDDMRIAIEAKSSEQIRSDHLKGLRKLTEGFKVKKKLIVCCEKTMRKTQDGILILPYKIFLKNIKHFLS